MDCLADLNSALREVSEEGLPLGWGNVDGFLAFLRRIVSECPKETLQVVFPKVVETAGMLVKRVKEVNEFSSPEEIHKIVLKTCELFLELDLGKNPPKAIFLRTFFGPLISSILSGNDFEISAQLLKISIHFITGLNQELRFNLFQTQINHLKHFIRLMESCGDYDTQASVIEFLFRLAPQRVLQEETRNCFRSDELWTKFHSISKLNFETDVRRFLLKFNENNSIGTGCSVHSIPCDGMEVSGVPVSKPNDPDYTEFWVDFNEGSRSILVNLSRLNSRSDVWDALIIRASDVESVTLDFLNKYQNNLRISLIKPAYHFFDSASNSSFPDQEIKITFKHVYPIDNICRVIFEDLFYEYISTIKRSISQKKEKEKKEKEKEEEEEKEETSILVQSLKKPKKREKTVEKIVLSSKNEDANTPNTTDKNDSSPILSGLVKQMEVFNLALVKALVENESSSRENKKPSVVDTTKFVAKENESLLPKEASRKRKALGIPNDEKVKITESTTPSSREDEMTTKAAQGSEKKTQKENKPFQKKRKLFNEKDNFLEEEVDNSQQQETLQPKIPSSREGKIKEKKMKTKRGRKTMKKQSTPLPTNRTSTGEDSLAHLSPIKVTCKGDDSGQTFRSETRQNELSSPSPILYTVSMTKSSNLEQIQEPNSKYHKKNQRGKASCEASSEFTRGANISARKKKSSSSKFKSYQKKRKGDNYKKFLDSVVRDERESRSSLKVSFNLLPSEEKEIGNKVIPTPSPLKISRAEEEEIKIVKDYSESSSPSPPQISDRKADGEKEKDLITTNSNKIVKNSKKLPPQISDKKPTAEDHRHEFDLNRIDSGYEIKKGTIEETSHILRNGGRIEGPSGDRRIDEAIRKLETLRIQQNMKREIIQDVVRAKTQACSMIENILLKLSQL